VMVGFPGETDALFQESYDFIAAQPLTYLHLFPYSPRPRTAAEVWHREQPVAGHAVRERMQALEALGRDKHHAFVEGFVGHSLPAVTLRNGTALTANFLSVHLQPPVAANRSIQVLLASYERGTLLGTEVLPPSH
jgi:threonylcarbamoyladenosine tRNA methylthiotransferase MtaB